MGGQIVGTADRTLAKIIASKYLFDSIQLGFVGLPTTISSMYVIAIYLTKIAHIKEAYKKGKCPKWHLSMHLVGQFGVLYKHLITK